VEFLLVVGGAALIIWAIVAAIEEAAKSAPSNVAKDAARFDRELRAAVEKPDDDRAKALLMALPRWPPRESLLSATTSLMELRKGTAHATAAGVSQHFLRDVDVRDTGRAFAMIRKHEQQIVEGAPDLDVGLRRERSRSARYSAEIESIRRRQQGG
jgi:hypothetical protein